ncbi:hypothetical protein SAMN04489806_1806 [Paramicrobacterium humi]|uniref:DUF559 domain-containing protein n=1 Tax=Paramicrobacterium humi TaxID=640635 RepID=A0A1H4MB99_9MICO|nr:hypothetical protein [Microbacterium humi]SEB80008.1 hypothetical protein SAMN04489806_1806 [Microbacterium humi]
MAARHDPIPAELGSSFSIDQALKSGVGRGRLRHRDLQRPFHGVRAVPEVRQEHSDEFARVRADSVRLARAYAHRMRAGEFFCHETAARIYGAPLPFADEDEVHVGVFRPLNASVSRGVRGHSFDERLTSVVTYDGLRVASPASVWAMMGERLSEPDLVVLGDFFCRVWREEGYYRINPGAPPLTTPERLQKAMTAGRRRGIAKLRAALPLVRLDSWSPRESLTRYHLHMAGLPEPVLNTDYYDDFGGHLGCLDISYPQYKVGIEYQGVIHAASYARDVERIERLRANGWIIIQVTARLLADPDELVRRARAALVRRGWAGEA